MVTQAVFGLPAAALVALFVVFAFGGLVKGVTGVGLPLVLVPLATQFVQVPVAVALVSVSMVVTNLQQSMEGGSTARALRQLWPIMVPLAAGGVIGTHLLITIDRRRLDLVIGISFLALAVLLLSLPRVRLVGRAARWGGPFVGFGAGVLGGMSAIFGPPMIAYMVSTGVPPDTFVKHMAVLALTASVTMLLVLGGSGAMSGGDFLMSAAAMIPIQLGMPLGRWLRGAIKPDWFRVLVLVVLAASGVDMLRKALF
ncbi:MAG TPA: sulfite exporter TauE/SafE family protein [Stellaceae bacterium]|nr:sulfite exporter TauE/SafE family protein [Stellaceae bacterium]